VALAALHLQEKDDYAWLESADGEHEARPYIDAENRLAMMKQHSRAPPSLFFFCLHAPI
jgi:hypothetical protein